MNTTGIDVYLIWDGMTEADHDAQITGFSPVHGHVGYLREAYHGEPYATMELVTENWDEQPYNEDAVDQEGCGFSIPNAELKRRLPKVLKAAEERERTIYQTTDKKDIAKVLKSFKDFVALHSKLEKAGKNPRILISY